MSTSKDKRKKLLKRLSKIRRSERKDKKKKRTKNRSSSRNSLYQEYAYQQKSRTSTYLLVLFIVLLLAAVGVIVYFFAIKPKLDEEKKKECNVDCGETKYLNKEDCECLDCIEPTCEPKQYYDTSKCNEENPKYECQPCPTDCGPDKRREGCSGLSKGECVDIPTPPPSSNDNKKSGVLRPGAIAGIVFGVIAFLVLVALVVKKRSGSKRINNPREQVFENPVYGETTL